MTFLLFKFLLQMIENYQPVPNIHNSLNTNVLAQVCINVADKSIITIIN